MSTIFTFAGKAGDAIMQWPVAYQWSKATGKKFTCWMDEKSCKMVAPLFEAQPCVEKVEFKPGIENYNCGGQPFHFSLETKDFEGHTIYHLGLRAFPVRQLTLQCLEDCKIPTKIDTNRLSSEPSLIVDGKDAAVRFFTPTKNRVILHGQPVCPHNRQIPQFWKFLAGIAPWLEANFDEILFVGDERDREVGLRTYPSWKEYDDEGNFLNLARMIAESCLVIGVGSSVVTLGGALKVSTVRVHDPIGNHPKVIWSNLGQNQLNDAEIELRTSFPPFRNKWLSGAMEAVNG